MQKVKVYIEICECGCPHCDWDWSQATVDCPYCRYDINIFDVDTNYMERWISKVECPCCHKKFYIEKAIDYL